MHARNYVMSAVVVAALGCVFLSQNVVASVRYQIDPCADSRDLRLINGQIHTMDAENSVVSIATIQNGRFVEVGEEPGFELGPCAETIDLEGRTAVPGLVDNHNHIVLLGIRPGHDTRLESAGSIAQVQEIIRRRAEGVTRGEFITAMGGWNQVQFDERRLPTLAELDAATSDHPVIVFQAFNGPSATNSLGRDYFTERGVEVSDDGGIAGGQASLAAFNALRDDQTFEDQRRGTLDALNYGTSLGLTTHADMGAFVLPGTADVHDAFAFDTLASANPFTMYDAFNSLHNDGELSARLRIYSLTMDTRPDVPLLRERLNNTFPGFGDDMMRTIGIGEFASAWNLFGQGTPENYETALQLVAREGWAFQQHSLLLAEDQFTAETFEAVNAVTPIGNLRWSVSHVPRIDRRTVDRFTAIGAGIAVHPFTYLAGGPGSGPPLRMILDSGARVGAGSDSAQISTLNPWLIIYYMVTGLNSSGELINDGQQVTRQEALWLYTAANGWFLGEEGKLGSIEEGKLGDLVVLSDNFFSETSVSDEAIKSIRSVLTIVDGRVVHSEMD